MRASTYFSWTLWLPVALPLLLSALFTQTDITTLLLMSLVVGGAGYAFLALVLWLFWSRCPEFAHILVRVWLGPFLAYPVLFVVFMGVGFFHNDGASLSEYVRRSAEMAATFGSLFLLFGYPYVLLATLGYFLLKWWGRIVED